MREIIEPISERYQEILKCTMPESQWKIWKFHPVIMIYRLLRYSFGEMSLLVTKLYIPFICGWVLQLRAGVHKWNNICGGKLQKNKFSFPLRACCQSHLNASECLAHYITISKSQRTICLCTTKFKKVWSFWE